MGSLLFLAAMMGGRGGINSQLMTALAQDRKDRYEKIAAFIKALAGILTSAVFYIRGMPEAVDATTGSPVYTNEALSKQLSATGQEGKLQALWMVIVNNLTDTLLTFFKPSESEWALFASLMGGAAAPTTTVITAPAAAPAAPTAMSAPTARMVLQSGGNPNAYRRAQAVYVGPNGEMIIE